MKGWGIAAYIVVSNSCHYIVGWMKGWRIALPYILSGAGTICSCACMCAVLPDCLDSAGTNLCGELE